MSGRKPPRLLSSGLTGRTYIVTAYTEHEDGRITANTKHGVTADLDAIAAERVAALAEELPPRMAVAWGGDARWLTTGATVAELVGDWLREEAATLAEPDDQDDEPEVCKCGHSAWTEHGGVMAPPAGCDVCACTLDERQAAAGVTPQYATRAAALTERKPSDG